jgi:hypothetical protein
LQSAHASRSVTPWWLNPDEVGGNTDYTTWCDAQRRGGRMAPWRKKALGLASLAAQESAGHEATVGALGQ